ncbi:hypothetical protein BDR03DRAFT_345451 [Suillus americanus]|nr:hypothetical protein BDR03DRAFT_345451 [Suillus americanus]
MKYYFRWYTCPNIMCGLTVAVLLWGFLTKSHPISLLCSIVSRSASDSFQVPPGIKCFGSPKPVQTQTSAFVSKLALVGHVFPQVLSVRWFWSQQHQY